MSKNKATPLLAKQRVKTVDGHNPRREPALNTRQCAAYKPK